MKEFWKAATELVRELSLTVKFLREDMKKNG